MSWTKTILTPGNGEKPTVGSNVKIDYTGWLRDPSNSDHQKGKEFDSSRGRGPLAVRIGTGQVIKGWDEGVLTMSLGEEAVLTIDSSYAYGQRGFPGVIPAGSDLIFQVKLVELNGKRN